MERAKVSPSAELLSRPDFTPSQFKDWVASREQAARAIDNCITEQVEQGFITPYEGGACVSAVWGSITGYRQFHNELAPSDLVQTLGSSLRESNSR